MEKRMTEIIDSADKHTDKDVIIRYLIVNLACFFKRDLNFYLKSEEVQAEMLNSWHKYNGDGNIICLTLAEFYVDLFKHFNIEAKVVRATRTMVPLYGIIVKGTHCDYFIDPLGDLMPSQYGIFNHSYGSNPYWNTSVLREEYPNLGSLSCEYVTFLDKEIERFKDGDITGDALRNCDILLSKSALINAFGKYRIDTFDSTNYKIDFIGKNCINFGKVDGLIERHKMYEYLFKRFLDGPEKGLVRHHIFRDYDCGGNPINPELNIIVSNKNKGIEAQYVETRENGIYTLKRKR